MIKETKNYYQPSYYPFQTNLRPILPYEHTAYPPFRH